MPHRPGNRYFTDGLYPAGANLAAAATEAGLDGAAARAFAEDPANKAAVAVEARRNAMSGTARSKSPCVQPPHAATRCSRRSHPTTPPLRAQGGPGHATSSLTAWVPQRGHGRRFGACLK